MRQYVKYNLILILCLFFLGISCTSSKKIIKDEPMQNDGPAQADSLSLARHSELTEAERALLKKILDELEDVPFDFDKHILPSRGLEIIKKNVALLNQLLASRGKFIRLTLEGHCDDRGSEEYNLALGDKRATVVKDYLLAVGFAMNSIQLISFGEERPKVEGQDEEAWAANRRVHIVVN